jgi:hypothetical protein
MWTRLYRDSFALPLTEASHEFNAQPLHSVELEHNARVECSVATFGPRTTEQKSHGEEWKEQEEE